jgi:hypothetical protein
MTLGVVLGYGTSAWAIPAFARDQERPCTTCHIAFPKLEPFGLTFKQNGYRVATDEGKYIWETKEFPLAGFILLKYANETVEDNATGDTLEEGGKAELDEVEFFSGGALSRRFSYFMDFASEEGEPFGPGAAFLIVNDLAPDARLNLKIGRMDNEFFYLSSPRRLTLTDYLAPVAFENTGIEANGYLPMGIRYAVGAGNDETDLTEVDGGKAVVHPGVGGFYGWVTYTVADQTIGVRYYAAKADSCITSDPADETVCLSGYDDQSHTQFDGNLDLHAGPVNLILAYYQQNNIEGVEDLERTNLVGELIYVRPVADSSLVAVSARYEQQDTETSPSTEDEKDTQYVLSVAYYPIFNVRFVAEYSSMTGDESGADVNKVQLAAHFGF